MAVNDALADRIRTLIAGERAMAERRMFGSLAFLVHGNMALGVHGSELIVRVHPDATAEALGPPGVRAFDLTGRPMKGWLLIAGDALRRKAALAAWVDRGVAYAKSLPRK